MKILLRNNRTHLYLNRSGGWTDAVSEAVEFSLASDAFEFCDTRHLKDMEMRLSFGTPASECWVPIEHVSIH